MLAVLAALLLCGLGACTGGNGVKQQEVALDQSRPDANRYLALLPGDGVIEAWMVLIPGFGESPADVLAATSLPRDAAQAHIAVFIPTLQDGIETYSFAPEGQACLDRMTQDIKERFNLQDKPFVVGGFSMGGSAAVKFAERAMPQPVCIFAIDSPLDFERFYYAQQRDVEVYRKGLDEGDSIYVKLLNDIVGIMGSTPQVNIESYHQLSPYSLSDTSHQAIRALKDVPVRVYIEPAEQWWLDNRQTDVLGLNVLDATAMINDLRLLGNKRAELIVTRDKGRRGEKYHPHSWTIVDNKELIEWIKTNLKDEIH